jgi:hypothetical protein
MIRRLLWLGIGIGIGVAVVRVVSRRLAPASLAGTAQEAIGGLAASVRNFVDDVRDGMHDREDEIRDAFAEGVALDAPDLPWAQGVGHKFAEFKQQLEEGDDER